jgi:hypothetical protein
MSYFKNDLKNSRLYCEFLALNLNEIDFGQITIKKKEVDPVSNDQTKQDLPVELPIVEQSSIDSFKCMAKTSSHVQCSRRKKKGCDFCGSHTHNQPFGRFNLDETTTNMSENVETEPVSDMSTASIQVLDGIEYVVDDRTNNIYKMLDNVNPDDTEINMDNLSIVGKKLPDQSIRWYSESDILNMT